MTNVRLPLTDFYNFLKRLKRKELIDNVQSDGCIEKTRFTSLEGFQLFSWGYWEKTSEPSAMVSNVNEQS